MTEPIQPIASAEAETNALLQRLLSGNASEEDQIRWERLSEYSPLLQDALEGLKDIRDPAFIESLQLQINSRLHQIARKKRRGKLSSIGSDPMVIVLTVILLLAAAISVYLLVSTGNSAR
jgi:ferric-dicitrate binding protein FerR (iron transport regulator)